MSYQNRIKKYDINFFYSQRQRYTKQLPSNVFKILNMNTKINMVVDERKLKIFDRTTKNFNKEDLQKKINANLNKLSEENIENIYAVINVILKERKDILLDYTIKNLLNKAIIQPIFCDLYAKFYKKFYNQESQVIFMKMFDDLLELMENKLNYSDDKNYESFCKFMKDKSRFIGLFNFISSLYREKIVNEKQINHYVKYLVDKMEKESNEDTEKYYDCICKFLLNIKSKKLIKENIETLMKLRDNPEKKLGMKYKFMCMDLKELMKKL